MKTSTKFLWVIFTCAIIILGNMESKIYSAETPKYGGTKRGAAIDTKGFHC